MHRGILHFTQGGRVFFLLDRREAWYALPEAVRLAARREP